MCTAQVLSLGICLDFLGWSLVPWALDPPALWTMPTHSPPLLLPVRDTVSHSAKLLWFSSPSSLLQTCLWSASLHLAHKQCPGSLCPDNSGSADCPCIKPFSDCHQSSYMASYPLDLSDVSQTLAHQAPGNTYNS